MQVPDGEPAEVLDVYPLMIRCGDFFVGGDLWHRYRQKFRWSRMIDFLDLPSRHRYCRVKKIKNFYSAFDSLVLETRRKRREEARCSRGEPLVYPKEEPVDDVEFDLENRHYDYIFRPSEGES